MYPSRISTPLTAQPTTEDFFESSLSALFTDNTQNSHGVPGSSVTYHSPRYGDITLRIPVHPDVEDGRQLFAHYLWNAAVICADAVEETSWKGSRNREKGDLAENQEAAGEGGREKAQWDPRYWDVTGRRVLELGAGTALPSIICILSGASHSVITDHPSSPALTSDAIRANIKDNILTRQAVDAESGRPAAADTQIDVFGYAWGTSTMYSPGTQQTPAPTQPDRFDRIIIADCLWMPSQHGNLVRTTLQYLSSDPAYDTAKNNGTEQPCALVIAGFHTGRSVVANFFAIATEETGSAPDRTQGGSSEGDAGEQTDLDEDADVRGKLRATEIFEIDVNGERREWQPVRQGETKQDAKRWCVCAVLVRR